MGRRVEVGRGGTILRQDMDLHGRNRNSNGSGLFSPTIHKNLYYRSLKFLYKIRSTVTFLATGLGQLAFYGDKLHILTYLLKQKYGFYTKSPRRYRPLIGLCFEIHRDDCEQAKEW